MYGISEFIIEGEIEFSIFGKTFKASWCIKFWTRRSLEMWWRAKAVVKEVVWIPPRRKSEAIPKISFISRFGFLKYWLSKEFSSLLSWAFSATRSAENLSMNSWDSLSFLKSEVSKSFHKNPWSVGRMLWFISCVACINRDDKEFSCISLSLKQFKRSSNVFKHKSSR